MKAALCLVSHGAAYRDHEKSLARLRHAHPDWIELELAGMPCLDIGRASVAESGLFWAEDARKAGHENPVLVWLDADMVFSVRTIEEVAAAAIEKDSLVGCLYAGKKFGAQPQAAWLEGGESEVICFKGGGLHEVAAIGFGVVAMPASMLERVAEFHKLPRLAVLDHAFRPWFTNDPSWGVMHSDDYAFCRRAREAGFKIWADTRQRVGHIGLHTYQLEDALPLTRFESLNLYDPAKKREAAE